MAASRDAGLEVEGARELRRTLRRAGSDLKDLKKANAKAANIAAIASASLAPKRSGRLAQTIRSSGTNTAGIIRAGTARVPYANAVHWGRKMWPNRTSPRAVRSMVTPNPFISDGARNSEGRWRPVYESELEEIIFRIRGA